MDTSTISAKDRQQLEELLDRFDRALRDSRAGALPDIEEFLGPYQGKARQYLRREMEALVADLVRGEYVKLRRVGGGGMGEVFLVRHTILGREFALKEIKLEVLQQGDRDEFSGRFQREIAVFGQLEYHPNIVSATNTGTTEQGVPYLVMEYIDGEDLKQIVERQGAIEINNACKIIHDAAVGLAYIHDKGHVHRDIKPSNLMISKHGEVKVLDLGLARCIAPDRQTSFVSMPGLVGSFDYMSPEQCREEREVDARADIYSLGCTLYYLLAGRPPFEHAKSIFQKLNAHQQTPPPLIPQLARHPQLAQILDKMLAKDVSERYSNLRPVIAGLRPLTAGANLESLVQSDRNGPVAPREDSGAGSTLPLVRGTVELPPQDGHAHSLAEERISRRKAIAVGLGVAAAGAGVGAASFFLTRRPTTLNPRLANFIMTLPGLNGRWWFEEVPWLLPEVRLELTRALSAESPDVADDLYKRATAADTPGFYTHLLERINATRGAWPEATRKRFFSLQNLDPEELGDDKLDEVLREITEPLRLPDANLSATELHLLAIVEHHLNQFKAAATAYNAAEQLYEREGQMALRALCLADLGQLRVRQRRPGLAPDKFAGARNLVDSLPEESRELAGLFRLDTFLQEGDSHRGIPNLKPARTCLADASDLAQSILPENHPQRAMCHERAGWYHVDVWRLPLAKTDFEVAQARREEHSHDNHRALHFVYWNRQGRAMVEFYDGENGVVAAREMFLDILRDIDTQFDITTKQLKELQQRRPNLRERLADTYLVEKAFTSALEALGDAIELAREEGFDDDARWPVLIRLTYKAALVAALGGDMAEARKQMATADDDAARFLKPAQTELTSKEVATGAVTPDSPSESLTAQLAKTVVKWLGSADEKSKRATLPQLVAKLNRPPRTVSRDELLLLLVVSDWLLTEGNAPPDVHGDLVACMALLSNVKPTEDPVRPSDWKLPAGWRPKLFERYAKRAEEAKKASSG